MAPPHFIYTVSPSTVAHGGRSDPSVVDLQISVYNPYDGIVFCRQIEFILASGDGNSDLVAEGALSAIVPSAAAGTLWPITTNGQGSFIATPNSGVTGLTAHESIAFLLFQVEVNHRSGLAAVTAKEQVPGWPLATAPVPITKVAPGLVAIFTRTVEGSRGPVSQPAAAEDIQE